jgi:hypothetical protein
VVDFDRTVHVNWPSERTVRQGAVHDDEVVKQIRPVALRNEACDCDLPVT